MSTKVKYKKSKTRLLILWDFNAAFPIKLFFINGEPNNQEDVCYKNYPNALIINLGFILVIVIYTRNDTIQQRNPTYYNLDPLFSNTSSFGSDIIPPHL